MVLGKKVAIFDWEGRKMPFKVVQYQVVALYTSSPFQPNGISHFYQLD